jgi:hypothetical protein
LFDFLILTSVQFNSIRQDKKKLELNSIQKKVLVIGVIIFSCMGWASPLKDSSSSSPPTTGSAEGGGGGGNNNIPNIH